mgnify:CR=1 FL=1
MLEACNLGLGRGLKADFRLHPAKAVLWLNNPLIGRLDRFMEAARPSKARGDRQ